MSNDELPPFAEIPFAEIFWEELRNGYRSPVGWLRVGTLAPISAVGWAGTLLTRRLFDMRFEMAARAVIVAMVLLCFFPFIVWIAVFIGLPN
jgi:hypothetical protein